MNLKSKAIACCHSHSQLKGIYLTFPQTPCLLRMRYKHLSMTCVNHPHLAPSYSWYSFPASIFSHLPCFLATSNRSNARRSLSHTTLMSISNQHSFHTSPTRQKHTLLSKHSSNILSLYKGHPKAAPHTTHFITLFTLCHQKVHPPSLTLYQAQF